MPVLVERLPQHEISDRSIRVVLKPVVFALSLVPAGLLLWSSLTHQYNVNPFNAIVRSTGFWSLRFLCLTLAITPFRWLAGWHAVVKFRRMMGLFAFFYGTLHLVAYIVFDRLAGLDAPVRSRPLAATAGLLRAIGVDLLQRPFFAIGFAAFVLIVPLAATSSAGMIRRLGGRRWRAVHRGVYVAAIASVLHTYWPLRIAVPRYAVVLGVLFTARLARARVRRRLPTVSPHRL